MARAAATAILALALAIIATPAAAHTGAGAHELVPGVGGVPGAALHTLTAADQVMALAAAGLLAGSGGWRGFAGGLIGLTAGFVAGYANLLYGSAIPFAWLGGLMVASGAGLATAFDFRPPAAIAFLAPAFAGLVIGNGTFPEADNWGAIIATGGGTFVGIALILGVPTAISAVLRTGWPRILTRVIASWIAASALMVLAFALAPLLQ